MALHAPLMVNGAQIGYVYIRRLFPDGHLPAGSGDTICRYEWRLNINGVTCYSIDPIEHRYGDGPWALVARVIEAAGLAERTEPGHAPVSSS